ncbi:acyltransferase [Mycolicibacterium sarraceniae]|uniref:Acyltransferase n=2 Tax=Mycolicibacterium sarraceniae TaxID=1534348 RepID=A0A7I7SSU9_9MYCO|nr:acyltransferase [Mycolicibacterium sarraceniae]BBY59813.1 acyltransferase [Mycolicibacterium sarraceniae]
MKSAPSLAQAFDPRNNALNSWRLALATGVILWHSWPLTGHTMSFSPALRLLGEGFVDGFFAISGFLITWSWFRHPRLRDYFVARALRILPGLWICLIVVAFVIAPIAVAIQHGSVSKLLLSRAPFDYVLRNGLVVIQAQSDIGGTPSEIPWPGSWNGSLWTLQFEVLCYFTVAVLGATTLLRRRWVIPVLWAVALFFSIQLPSLTDLQPQPTPAPLDFATSLLIEESNLARLFLMFFSGALIYHFRNVIPARWSLVALSVVLVLGASVMSNYRLIGAVPLAYALLASGALIRSKRLNLRTDLSYGVYIYAFPVQQLLVICGLFVLNPFVFATIAAIVTLPLAALSWFLVEKRALSWKSRLTQRDTAPPAEPRPG